MALFGSVALASVVVERRRHGTLEQKKTPSSILHGPWPLVAGALGLAARDGVQLGRGEPRGVHGGGGRVDGHEDVVVGGGGGGGGAGVGGVVGGGEMEVVLEGPCVSVFLHSCVKLSGLSGACKQASTRGLCGRCFRTSACRQRIANKVHISHISLL